jgi:hypothetical protein
MRDGKALATRSNAALSDSFEIDFLHPFVTYFCRRLACGNGKHETVVSDLAFSIEDDIKPVPRDLRDFRYTGQQLILDQVGVLARR